MTKTWLIPLVFLLFSCSHPETRKAVDGKPVKTLIHPLFFQEEIASRINFPFWFDASLVSSHKIASLKIDTYRVSGDDEELLYSRTFNFARNGRLTNLGRVEFMDDIAISDKRYSFFGEPRGNYRPVVVVTDSAGMNKSNTYRLVKPVSSRRDLYDYFETVGMKHLFFLPNLKKQGALSVDSIAHPEPNDWVILGTPEKPLKRYHVVNTVTEFEVITYTYEKNGLPELIQWSDFPFRQKRYFHYVVGKFKGFTDYSLIDNKAISTASTAILYDGELPRSIVKYRKTDDGREILQKELIAITFY